MKRSVERILTTHTGSLPRPQRVVELLLAEQKSPGGKAAELKDAVRAAVAEVVEKQTAAGLDVINDGEQGRTDYTTHVKDRLTGFDGPSSPPLGTGEPDFPELSAMLAYFASPFQNGLLGSGDLQGFSRARGRHRAGEAGDGRRQGRRAVLHLAVAGADRALPQEPALPHRGGLSLCAGRRDGEGISRDHRRRLHPAARLPGPGAEPPHGVRPSEPGRIPQGDHYSRRGAQPRGQGHP